MFYYLRLRNIVLYCSIMYYTRVCVESCIHLLILAYCTIFSLSVSYLLLSYISLYRLFSSWYPMLAHDVWYFIIYVCYIYIHTCIHGLIYSLQGASCVTPVPNLLNCRSCRRFPKPETPDPQTLKHQKALNPQTPAHKAPELLALHSWSYRAFFQESLSLEASCNVICVCVYMYT